MSAWEQVAWLAVGAFVSLILSVVFEDTARAWYGRARALKWTTMAALRSTTQLVTHDLFGIGRWRIPCVVLEGTPKHAFNPDRLTSTIEPEELVLPPELKLRRETVAMQQANAAARTGIPTYSNGPMVALAGYRRGRHGPLEESVLSLQFRRCDYYAFLATSMSLDEPLPGAQAPGLTIRARFLRDADYRRPLPELATSFGVNLAVITADRQLIVGKRGDDGLSAYRGAFAVSVSETVNPDADIDDGNRLNIYRTARRGLDEEMGIVAQHGEIQLVSLCVDTALYQYGMTGIVQLRDLSWDNLIGRRSRGIKDKWEQREWRPVQFKPDAVKRFLEAEGGVGRWHPTSLVAVVQALQKEFGEGEVERWMGDLR